MERDVFINWLPKVSNKFDKEEILKVINRSIDSNLADGNPRGHRNLIIVMEELAELSQQVSKAIREKENYYELLEELADVQIGIYYIQNICNVSDDALKSAINVKIENLDEKLNEKGFYQ